MARRIIASDSPDRYPDIEPSFRDPVKIQKSVLGMETSEHPRDAAFVYWQTTAA